MVGPGSISNAHAPNPNVPLSHVQQASRVQQQQEIQGPQQGLHREISDQLNLLLDRVGRRTATAIDVSDIALLAKSNRQLRKLDGFKELVSTANLVQKRMQMLDTFSGKQIISAFDPATNSWRGQIGQQINDTAEALSKLSEDLLSLINNPKVADDPKMHALLTEKYMQNCCRESELNSVLMTIVDIQYDETGERANLSAEAKESLTKTVGSWMASSATQLHGTQSILANDLAFKELAQILDELKGDDQDNVSAAKQDRLVSVVRAAKASVHNLSLSDATIDKSFFKEAEALFSKILTSLHSQTDVKRAAFDSIITRNIDACINLTPCLNFSNDFIEALKSDGANCRELANYLQARNELQGAFRNYMEAFQQRVNNPKLEKEEEAALNRFKEAILNAQKAYEDGSKGTEDRLLTQIQQLQLLAAHHKAAITVDAKRFDAFPKLSDTHILELLQKDNLGDLTQAVENGRREIVSAMGNAEALGSIITRGLYMIRENEYNFNTKQLLSSIFTHELPISALVECRLSGINDCDVDPTLCDANIANRRTFGQGGFNVVQEVTMKDGRVFIFKPEISARTSTNTQALAQNAYERGEAITPHNIAAHKAAEFFGMNNITATKLGVCGGQLGIFMEKAPGIEANAFVKNQNPQRPVSGVPLADKHFQKLDDATFTKVNGQIMKQCYDLEWLDFIIGSGDRHSKNYLINIDNNNDVSLKGIDNDMTFGEYRTSFSSVNFKGERARIFLANCISLIKEQSGQNLSAKEVLAKLTSIKGIDHDPESLSFSISVNLEEIDQPWIRAAVSRSTGMHQLVLPRFIDRKLYDFLMNLDKNKDAKRQFCEEINKRVGYNTSFNTLSRLSSAIDYAKKLNDKGRVITNWEQSNTQKFVFKEHERDNATPPDSVFEESKNKLNNLRELRFRHNLYFRDFAALAQKRLSAIPEDPGE